MKSPLTKQQQELVEKLLSLKGSQTEAEYIQFRAYLLDSEPADATPNILPEWYRLPTAEPGYRFLEQTELPINMEGVERWWCGEWKDISETGIRGVFGLLWAHRESIKRGEGKHLFRVKI